MRINVNDAAANCNSAIPHSLTSTLALRVLTGVHTSTRVHHKIEGKGVNNRKFQKILDHTTILRNFWMLLAVEIPGNSRPHGSTANFPDPIGGGNSRPHDYTTKFLNPIGSRNSRKFSTTRLYCEFSGSYWRWKFSTTRLYYEISGRYWLWKFRKILDHKIDGKKQMLSFYKRPKYCTSTCFWVY
jgi:hypothetical protein